MFNKLKQRFADMGTIKTLCERAEAAAHEQHQGRPGAEHFVLAALDLSDGSAKRVFSKLGISGADFRRALRDVHHKALNAAGVGAEQIVLSEQNVPPLPHPAGIYDAAPSGQAVLQGLAALRQRGVRGPLLSVHVLEVVSAMQHGTTNSAFQLLGHNQPSVMAAIQSEMVLAA
ncbi:Clp protease N-terminal domain-containing protein [Devosia submarina]|uniref:Clp protease N-terminal domain-containing protein n=1 Tax=Devosia submarina TaxID=1173082 RepID=UPI000D3D204B|nr:Clp protease N-terminal domain-containing protein [Devosia submarina]